ncbi:hypothetical protein SAMN05216311_107379 [Chitinophaga sp. CF418]|nr:hypothetical protein SAMN05216311_107379 [Chitinophaga sp. CF418]
MRGFFYVFSGMARAVIPSEMCYGKELELVSEIIIALTGTCFGIWYSIIRQLV